MRKRSLIAVLGVVMLSQATLANPIPSPLPASMPLEEMWIDIERTENALYATFAGDFTFNYIPTDVASMFFPVPVGASNVHVRQDGAALSWTWSSEEHYPTILPEMPTIPMIEWPGPFPESGAVFTVEYEHELIERPDEFIFFYALGTGKYFPTYEKTTTAYFDILLPGDFDVAGVWLDETAHEYEVVGGHLMVTVESQFGPIVKDLIVSLVPQPAIIGDFNGDGDVDAFDFGVWQENYPTASGATRAMGDANGDGDVDAFDLSYWQVNYPYPPAPEPATLGLLLVGGLALLRRRCKLA